MWWRTRDTRATCHNWVTVTSERYPLKSPRFSRSLWYNIVEFYIVNEIYGNHLVFNIHGRTRVCVVMMRGNFSFVGHNRFLGFLQTSSSTQICSDQKNDNERGRHSNDDRNNACIQIKVESYIRLDT